MISGMAQVMDQLTVPPLTLVLSILHACCPERGVEGPRAIGGSGSSEVMHSVSLSATPFDLNSAPSGALGPDTTAENAHLPGLIEASACAAQVAKVAKRMTATVGPGRGFSITEI